TRSCCPTRHWPTCRRRCGRRPPRSPPPRSSAADGRRRGRPRTHQVRFPSARREVDTMGCIGARDQRRRGRETGTGLGGRGLRPTVMALEGRALLSTLTVTKAGNDDGGTGTLSWAVGKANGSPGPDTIAFSSLFDSAQTITLTGGQLTLTDAAATITG